jgi:(p)ppGpp synthase/HD superfamily hydrolase
MQITTRGDEGQVRKAGIPGKLHRLRVMHALDGEAERIAAILHDVLEDSDVTEDELRESGCSDSVLTALAHLARLADESYRAFMQRAARHPIARRVKLADLHDNSDITRVSRPSERDLRRAAKYRKYRKAIAELESLDS